MTAVLLTLSVVDPAYSADRADEQPTKSLLCEQISRAFNARVATTTAEATTNSWQICSCNQSDSQTSRLFLAKTVA